MGHEAQQRKPDPYTELHIAVDRTKSASKPASKPIDHAHPTNNEAINTGGRGPCRDAAESGQCFLDQDQRAELAREFSGRVEAAQSAYMTAATELRIETHLKKTDELPWYLSLLLTAAGSAIEKGIAKAIDSVGNTVKAIDASVSGSVSKITDASKYLSKTGVSAATQTTKAPLGRATTTASEETQAKAATIGFYDYLRDRSMLLFQQVREDAVGTLNDADLKTLFESFDGTLHHVSHYKAVLGAALERYLESEVSRMGRRLAWDEKRDNRHVELETRVAWLLVPGAGKRLIFVDRAFSDAYQSIHERDPGTTWKRSAAYDDGHQLSLQQEATWQHFGAEEDRHETPLGPDMMINYVEAEFVEMALDKQDQIWLEAPETFALDYRSGSPKIIKVAS